MSTTTYFSYSVVEPRKIGATFSALMNQKSTEGEAYTRSAAANILLLCSSPEKLRQADALIDNFSTIHPGRFFVIATDDTLTAMQTEIASRCVPVSKSEHSCTEVIRILTPKSLLSAAAGIVRGQSLPGLALELCLFDGNISEQLFDAMSPMADVVYGDSGVFEGRPEMLLDLSKRNTQDVDLQWIILGPWRDEVRGIFYRAASSEALASLREVEVEYSGPDPDAPPVCAFLMAGWVAERVGLRMKGRKGKIRSACTSDGREVQFSFIRREATSNPALHRVKFGMRNNQSVELIRHGEGIESIVKIDPAYRSVRVFEEEEKVDALRRYFLIGESITNYLAAFRFGLALR